MHEQEVQIQHAFTQVHANKVADNTRIVLMGRETLHSVMGRRSDA